MFRLMFASLRSKAIKELFAKDLSDFARNCLT